MIDDLMMFFKCMYILYIICILVVDVSYEFVFLTGLIFLSITPRQLSMLVANQSFGEMPCN